jgi:hypothetical protein
MGNAANHLEGIEPGNPTTAERLLPLLFDKLRRLAAQLLAHEASGQKLQPTALVRNDGD